jgi:hypothetical protein
MAKTALTQLQDQIEAIRREAYNAGYTAAMQAIRDFVARPTAASTPTPRARVTKPPAVAKVAKVVKATKATKAAPQRRRRAAAKAPAAARRPQRGTNAKLIAEVLQGMPSGTARPAEIRSALQRDKGVAMAFTSIRHALGQLATRNEVEATADGKTWRYRGAAS